MWIHSFGCPIIRPRTSSVLASRININDVSERLPRERVDEIIRPGRHHKSQNVGRLWRGGSIRERRQYHRVVSKTGVDHVLLGAD